MHRATEKQLQCWASEAIRGRFDYDTPDHVFAEIFNDHYFGVLCHRFRRGDIIYVSTADGNRYTLIVDDVFKEEFRVVLSLDITHYSKPATSPASGAVDPGLTVRFRGNRGGKWCILNAEGEVVEKGFEARGEADRRLTNMLEAKAKAA